MRGAAGAAPLTLFTAVPLLARRAGVGQVAAVEVLEAGDRRVPGTREDLRDQVRELRRRAAAEIIDGARDEIAAFLPRAHSAVRARREEGVERRALRRVRAADARDRAAGALD